MRLRQTPARNSRKPLNEPTIDTKDSRQQKETCGSDSDDVSFEEITCFSPSCEEDNVSDEENFSNGNANNESDEEYVPETRSPKYSKIKISKTTKAASKEGKNQKQGNSSLLSDELALKGIIGNVEIATFKGILKELPEHFAEEYCRYLLALQDKFSSTPDKNSSKLRYSVYCSKAIILSGNNCVICGRKFSSSKELKKHVISEHETPDGYHCTPCDKLFKTLAKFNQHVTWHHSTNHQCIYCDLSFLGFQSLKKHLATAHSCKRRFMCTLCEKGFSKGFQLMMHINQHTGLTPHKCVKCPKAYRTSDSLREHERLHSKDIYQCDKCDKTFQTSKLLNLHAVYHETKKKFNCNLCEMTFRTRQNMLRHHLRHSKHKFATVKPINKKLHSNGIRKSKKKVLSEPKVNTESGDNVNSQESTCVTSTEGLDSTQLNQQPLHLEKTIFGDFQMERDSDEEEEAVYQLL